MVFDIKGDFWLSRRVVHAKDINIEDQTKTYNCNNF